MPPESRRRRDRHREVLDRWPVIGESWARAVEAARLDAGPRPASGPPTRDDAITPLTAINRALGLADDDGIDAVAKARAEQPQSWPTSGG